MDTEVGLGSNRGVDNRTQPRVSVLITAHNVGEYVREAVTSALRQTIKEIEVIVIDDGSTDGTPSVLRTVQDPRLRVIRQENQGSAAARNTGVRVAGAPLIAFLDGDDYWLPDHLERHLEHMDAHPETDLTFSLCSVVDEQGTQLAVLGPGPSGSVCFRDLLMENHARCGSAVVVRADVFQAAGLFDTSFKACDDYEMWLRIAALRQDNVLCVPEVLTCYRRRAGQISSDWRSVRDEFEQLLTKMAELAPRETESARPEATRNMNRYFAMLAYKKGETATALGLLRESFAAEPIRFLTDSRSWMVSAAVLARITLGHSIENRLEFYLLGWRNRWIESRLARDSTTRP